MQQLDKMIVIPERLNPKVSLDRGQFSYWLKSSGSLAAGSSVVDPCTDQCEPLCRRVYSCCSIPDLTAFILMHTFWCPSRRGCSSGDRVAEAWLCPSESSLLCPLLCQSLSVLCSLLPSSFFLSLIYDMVGSALLSAYGLFAGVCVRACKPSTLCDAHERVLSHNFLNEHFVNTVL